MVTFCFGSPIARKAAGSIRWPLSGMKAASSIIWPDAILPETVRTARPRG